MRLRIPVALIVAAVTGACVIQQPAIRRLDATRLNQATTSPVKVHLKDGSTALYPAGVSRDGSAITGRGTQYSIGSRNPTSVTRIPLDSVMGMESYGADVNVPASVLLTVGGIALGAVATAGAAVAIFGSCPTFYDDSAGTELLQAEGFSYAIAPLFEQRDVDRLRLTPTADGRVVLHVRNEMLETHYINHLELIEASRSADEEVVPDQAGKAVTISSTRIDARMTDRSGRNLSELLRAPDENLFSTVDARLASVTANDLDDYIDITFDAPDTADTVAVVLDMRNSLLNTVLLYDHILGAPGLKSLDYLGKDLEKISNAVDMGRWYVANMGMRVSVLDGDRYRRITRIGDSGPIAFHRMTVLVPVIKAQDGRVHVRLSFVADDWRIDQVAITRDWKRSTVRRIPVSRITVSNPEQRDAAVNALRKPDESYLITSPGQSFTVEFDAGSPVASNRTWMLASQGYYTEWVRGNWIKNASGKPFEPTNQTLVEAIRGWRAKQGSMEKAFYSQRIAAR